MARKRKNQILPLEEMNSIQQVVYELLPVGDNGKNNLSRKELVSVLGVTDSRCRQIIKSMLEFTPIVASKGYYIPYTVEEYQVYIDVLKNKIRGLQKTISYLEKHLDRKVQEDLEKS